MFWKETAPFVRFGAVWTICALICVAARLRITRRRTPPLDPSLPVREFCDREIVRVEDQIRLLRTAGVWYVAPLLFGALLCFAGLSGWNQKTGLYAVALVVLGALVTMLNRYAGKTQLEPIAARLRQLRDSLSGGPAFEEDPRQQAILMDRAVRNRDRREAVVAALGSLIVAATAWAVPNRITAIGSLVMILTWIFTVAHLHITQRRVPPADPSLPDMEFCDRELRRTEYQTRLLWTSGYWFFAPLVAGALVLIAGVFGRTLKAIAPTAFAIFFGIMMGRANREAVRMQLKPLAEQLRAWRESL
jgi:hypothetical protein